MYLFQKKLILILINKFGILLLSIFVIALFALIVTYVVLVIKNKRQSRGD